MRVQSLDGEDPLEEGMATLSSILTWRIPWTEEPGRLNSIGSQRSDTTEATWHMHTRAHTHTHTPLSDPDPVENVIKVT